MGADKKKKETEDVIQHFCTTEDAVDYKEIEELNNKSGVSAEYLKECIEIHGQNRTKIKKDH